MYYKHALIQYILATPRLYRAVRCLPANDRGNECFPETQKEINPLLRLRTVIVVYKVCHRLNQIERAHSMNSAVINSFNQEKHVKETCSTNLANHASCCSEIKLMVVPDKYLALKSSFSCISVLFIPVAEPRGSLGKDKILMQLDP